MDGGRSSGHRAAALWVSLDGVGDHKGQGYSGWGAYSLAEDGTRCGLGVSNLRISAGCSECTPLSQSSFLTKPQVPHYIGKNIQARLGLTRLYFVALSMAVAGTDCTAASELTGAHRET